MNFIVTTCDRVGLMMNSSPRREVPSGQGEYPNYPSPKNIGGVKMAKKMRNSKRIALTSMIAAIYAVMTVALAPVSYELVQIRIAELLTPLPFYFGLPAVVGLIVGCFVANAFSPFGVLDMALGTLGTACGAILSWKSKKLWQACLAPVITNAFWVGILLQYYGIPIWFGAPVVAIGEAIASFGIGYPVMKAIERYLPSMTYRDKEVK